MADKGEWIRIKASDVHMDLKSLKPIVEKILGEKISSVPNDRDFRYEIGAQYVKNVSEFVPHDSGDLEESGRPTYDGRVYWTSVHRGFNYAFDQYTRADYNHHSEKRRYRWTDALQPGTPKWGQFIEDITPIVIRRFKDVK